MLSGLSCEERGIEEWSSGQARWFSTRFYSIFFVAHETFFAPPGFHS
jgi:hypothetical protein